jgi:hypothetical protein
MRLRPPARGRSPFRTARLRLESLETRTVPATITWSGGPAGTGTNWLDPNNWVGGVLPGPNDDAVINAVTGATAEITIGASTSVRSVTVNTTRNVRQTAGTFAIGSAESKFYDLFLAGGTFDVADGATLAGNAPTYSQTAIDGPGTLTDQSGRTLTLQGTVIRAPVLNQGTLVAFGDSNTIFGTLTTTATSVIRLPGLSTHSTLQVVPALTNNGLIELAYGSAAPNDTFTQGGGNTLTNAVGGTINIPAGAGGSRYLNAVINNQGTFTVGAGARVTVGDFTNLNDTFTGGTYNLAGQVLVSARMVSTNAATVVLD